MRYYRNYGAKNINLAPIDDLVKVLPTQEWTGKIVTFNSPFAGLPLKSCKVNIPVTQEGTGDPSPDNVRNFVGISSLDFTANSVVKTFTFGQTIYTGELDVLTGIFTATHKLAIFDGSEDWIKSSSYSGGHFIDRWARRNSIPRSSDHLQNIGKTVGNLTDYSNCTNVCFFDGSLNFKVDGTLYPTLADFKEFLSQNNLQVWYPLPTPEVINLGGMDISTLQGENNLFASTGETTAKYFKK